MKIFDMLRDCRVDFITGGHKHAQDGWVNFSCPFCTGNPGYHLGYCVEEDFFTCWRCGGHSNLSVVKKLHDCSWAKAHKLLDQYAGASYVRVKKTQLAEEVSLPSGTSDMTKRHKEYLMSRNFNPDELERIWELQGTGPTGNYRFRIIAPIYLKGKLVSYQGRDITGLQELKYKACPKEKEVVEHKNTLYGIDKVKGNSIVIVEGITDVWRLGPGSVATLGIKFRPPQVALMRSFKNRFILYDDDIQAIQQADRLYNILSGFPGHTEVFDIEGDPGDLDQIEADLFMKECVGI